MGTPHTLRLGCPGQASFIALWMTRAPARTRGRWGHGAPGGACTAARTRGAFQELTTLVPDLTTLVPDLTTLDPAMTLFTPESHSE